MNPDFGKIERLAQLVAGLTFAEHPNVHEIGHRDFFLIPQRICTEFPSRHLERDQILAIGPLRSGRLRGLAVPYGNGVEEVVEHILQRVRCFGIEVANKLAARGIGRSTERAGSQEF